MAESRAVVALTRRWFQRAGLRPEPQSVRTPAARAAQRFGAEAESRGPYGKSVFDRHSTQSLFAARLRRAAEEFKDLGVDERVYTAAKSVDESPPARSQVPEYPVLGVYTPQTPQGACGA